MDARDFQRLAYRDAFRSCHNHEFQAWFESLAAALHPAGDFQRIRNTSGDGGLDGFAINSQLVYQVFAPSRMGELRDGETAAKMRGDFRSASTTLSGHLKTWVFVHNHPEGKIGQLTAAALSELKTDNPTITFQVLGIDTLWEQLTRLPHDTLESLFGGPPPPARQPDLVILTARFESLLSRDKLLTSGVTAMFAAFERWTGPPSAPPRFFPNVSSTGRANITDLLRTTEALVTGHSLDMLTPADVATLAVALLLREAVVHLSPNGFVALIQADDPSSQVLPAILPNEPPWSSLWGHFTREASRWDDATRLLLIGHTDPVEVHDIALRKEWTDDQRLLIGEFLRRNHARLAREIAYLNLPGASDSGTLGLDPSLKGLGELPALLGGCPRIRELAL